MKKIIILLGILLITGVAEAITIDGETNLELYCYNATSGALLGDTATLTCKNKTLTTEINALSLTNIGAGKFNCTFNLAAGTYSCVMDCVADALNTSFYIYSRSVPLITSELTSIETAISQNTTALATAITQNTSALATQVNLTDGVVALTSATETQIDAIETDTSAQDTASELRTLLTGGDWVISTQTNLTDGIIVLTTATENQIDAIETDTAAQDTASELKTLLTGGDYSVATQDNISTGLCQQNNLTDGIVVLTSATETQINEIETDTAAMDTASELRTLLTGGNWVISTQTNLTAGIIVLTSATETQIDNTEADTNEIQLNQTRLVTADISTLQTEADASTRYTNLLGNQTTIVEKLNNIIGYVNDVTGGGIQTIYDWLVVDANIVQDAEITGLATTAILNQNITAVIDRGDSVWDTATGFQTESDASTRYGVIVANATDIVEHGDLYWNSSTVSDFMTQDNYTDLRTHGDSGWATATGYETETDAGGRYDNLSANITDIVEHGDASWTGGATCPTNESIYEYFITGSNEDEFKADVSSLATTSNLNQNISGVITHGDLYWNSSTVSDFMTQNNYTDLKTHGDAGWITATGFETEVDAGGRYGNLSANMTDMVEHGDSDWDTATGFETETSASTRYDNLKANITDVVEHGDSGWITATGFASLTNATTILDAINALTDVSASQVWSYATRVLTNISVIAPDIYGHFIEGSNEDEFKADVSNLATTTNLNQNISGVIEHGDNYWNSSTVSIAGLATQVNLTDGVVVLTSATETQIDDIDTNVGYVLSNQSTLHSEINGVTDEVWDELLTGATHNIATSAGRRLRQIAGFAIRTETAQDGTINTIELDASASSTDGIYNRDLIVLTEGTGEGQTRIITEYNGTTKNVTINRDWKITPDATSVFQILANDVEGHPNHGYAQAGGVSNITLEGAASSTDDIYNGDLLYISTGTGSQQARLITDYNGSSKVATISPAWLTQPDSTSLYHIDYGVRVEVDTTNDKTGYALSSAGINSIWNKDISGWSVSGYAGTYLKTIYDNQTSFATATGFQTETNANTRFDALTANMTDIVEHGDTNWNSSDISGVWDETLASNKTANATISFLYDDLVYGGGLGW